MVSRRWTTQARPEHARCRKLLQVLLDWQEIGTQSRTRGSGLVMGSAKDWDDDDWNLNEG